jgi:hypothetical protein
MKPIPQVNHAVTGTLLVFKTEFVNLPISIPGPWRDFFDQTAASLGISRNAAVCLALKIGGPILQQHVQVMREQLRDECRRIQRTKQVSKILGLPPAPGLRGKRKAS